MAHYINNREARQGAVALKRDFNHDAQLPANCFSLSFSLNGAAYLEEGFYLSLNVPKHHGPYGDTHSPHLKVGHGFCRQNTRASLGCLYRETERGGHVRRAEIAEVNPIEGAPFKVLNRPSGLRPNFLLHVRFGLNGGNIKLKNRVRELDIWKGVTGTAEVIQVSAGEALVQFREGTKLYVMYPDGSVRLVACERGVLTLIPLTKIEMVEARVNSAVEELGQCDIRRRDGILWGMIKLLELTRVHVDAREVIVDFLLTQELSDSMREQIRVRLDRFRDERAPEFSNMMNLMVGRTERVGMPDERRKDRARRAAEDRALREKMRGLSGGGGKRKRN